MSDIQCHLPVLWKMPQAKVYQRQQSHWDQVVWKDKMLTREHSRNENYWSLVLGKGADQLLAKADFGQGLALMLTLAGKVPPMGGRAERGVCRFEWRWQARRKLFQS